MSRFLYTKEQEQFLIDNVKGITLKELTERFNKRFNCNKDELSIQNKKSKLHLKSGIVGGRFEKGCKTWNKGLKWDDMMSKESQEKVKSTMFQKGHKNPGERPLFTERENIYGYIEIKIENPRKWELKHRYLYEKYYGAIPEGYKVIFLDGNKRNFNKENLKAVKSRELLVMNINDLVFEDKELTETGLNIAKLMIKTQEKKKDKRK